MALSCDLCGKTSMGGFNPQSVGHEPCPRASPLQAEPPATDHPARHRDPARARVHPLPPDPAQGVLTRPAASPAGRSVRGVAKARQQRAADRVHLGALVRREVLSPAPHRARRDAAVGVRRPSRRAASARPAAPAATARRAHPAARASPAPGPRPGPRTGSRCSADRRAARCRPRYPATHRRMYSSTGWGRSSLTSTPSTQRRSGCWRIEHTTSRPSRTTWTSRASREALQDPVEVAAR